MISIQDFPREILYSIPYLTAWRSHRIDLGQQLLALHVEILDGQLGDLLAHLVVVIDGVPGQRHVLGEVVAVEVLLQIVDPIGHVSGLPEEVLDGQPCVCPLLVIVQLLALKVTGQLMALDDFVEGLNRHRRRLELVLVRGDRGSLLLPEVVRLDDHHVVDIRAEVLLQHLQYRLHVGRAVAIASHVNDDCESEVLGGVAENKPGERCVRLERAIERELGDSGDTLGKAIA